MQFNKDNKKSKANNLLYLWKYWKRPSKNNLLRKKKSIFNDHSSFKIDLEDNSIKDNKIYECFLQYESEKISYYIKINYGQDNYYFFGRNKNNMCLEFIFADFINKNINNNRCFIKYNEKIFCIWR